MATEVSLKLLFFAKARELVGRSETRLSVRSSDIVTGEALKRTVLMAFPNLMPISASVIVALNQEYITDGDTVLLRENDEVAIIPPISGG